MADTDVLLRLRAVPGLGVLAHDLLGCAWGRKLGTAEDHAPCDAQAVRITVLHDGDAEFAVKLCAQHTDLVAGLTSPHQPPTPKETP